MEKYDLHSIAFPKLSEAEMTSLGNCPLTVLKKYRAGEKLFRVGDCDWRRRGARLRFQRLRRREGGRSGICMRDALRKNPGQIGNANEAQLAREGQRLIAALLLGEARDPVLASVIDADLAAPLDRQPARARKVCVSEIVLRAGRGGTAQFRRPPSAGRDGASDKQADPAGALALRLKSPSFDARRRLAHDEAGKVVAERVDASLEAGIEHVADHDHSTLRPLSHAAELGMIELRLAPLSLRQRAEKRHSRADADAMTPCGVGHNAEPFGREVWHGLINS